MLILWFLISLLVAILSFAVGLVSTIGTAVLAFFLYFLALFLLWAAGGGIASLFVNVHTECKRDNPLFSKNLLRPCPLLDNPAPTPPICRIRRMYRS